MSTEFELFKGTNFSDLMRDVYHNSKKKSRQIDTLIQELQPLIKNIGDATVIVPLTLLPSSTSLLLDKEITGLLHIQKGLSILKARKLTLSLLPRLLTMRSCSEVL